MLYINWMWSSKMNKQLTNEQVADNIKDSLTNKEVDALGDSDEYAEFIMKNGERLICNGDMLLSAMEDGYLFDEFLIEKFV